VARDKLKRIWVENGGDSLRRRIPSFLDSVESIPSVEIEDSVVNLDPIVSLSGSGLA